MNTFAKIVGSVAIAWAVSASTSEAEHAGVSIEVLNCRIEIPGGYVLRWNESGMLQGSYTGTDIQSNPIFQYFPSTSFDSRASTVKRVIQETDLGEFRHLKVDLGQGSEWDVIEGESFFFAAWALPNSPFIPQFKACAESS